MQLEMLTRACSSAGARVQQRRRKSGCSAC
jgi:hypothetical protein